MIANAILVGLASWYGWECSGQKMANGQEFVPTAMTAASWDYNLGSVVRVTCTNTGKSVDVTITDRGPAKRLYKKGRIIDLSYGAFKKIADPGNGLVEVTVQLIYAGPNKTDRRQIRKTSSRRTGSTDGEVGAFLVCRLCGNPIEKAPGRSVRGAGRTRRRTPKSDTQRPRSSKPGS